MRTYYRDVDKILKKRAAKEKEIEAVDNGGVEAYNSPQPNGSETPTFTIQTKGAQPSMYANTNTTVGNGQQQQQYGSTDGGAALPGSVGSPQQPSPNMYPNAATTNGGGAYPSNHQQREPQTSARQQQSLRQEHQVPPSYGTQQPAMQQQQQQPVLHNNLFAGVVPGSTPIPQQQQQSAPSVDPFDVFDTGAMNNSLPPQQPYGVDPFAAAPVPQQQQHQTLFSPPAGLSAAEQRQQQKQLLQQQQTPAPVDPFAAGNQFQPSTSFQAPAPAAAYADPFAGL